MDYPKELIDSIFEIPVEILDYDLDRIYLSNDWIVRTWDVTDELIRWTLFHEMNGEVFERRSGIYYVKEHKT